MSMKKIAKQKFKTEQKTKKKLINHEKSGHFYGNMDSTIEDPNAPSRRQK